MKKCLLATGTLMIAFAAGTMLAPGLTGQEKGGKSGPAGPGLTLNSPDFTDGGIIPNKFTQADPMPVSPKLEWTNVPPGVASFALIFHDPEGNGKTPKTRCIGWRSTSPEPRGDWPVASRPMRRCPMEPCKLRIGAAAWATWGLEPERQGRIITTRFSSTRLTPSLRWVPTLLVQTSSRPWMDTYSGRLLSKAASTAENQPFITPFV